MGERRGAGGEEASLCGVPDGLPDDIGRLVEICFTRHPSPMWILDPETLRIEVVNDAMLSLYGYTREEFAAMTILDLRPESEHAQVREVIATKSYRGVTNRWRHRRANGEPVDVTTNGYDLRFRGRDMVLTILSDLSEISEARRRAAETRALLDSIVTHLPLGVFVKDMADDGRYVLYNRACGEIVGMDGAALVGRTDLALFGTEQGAEFRRQDLAVMGERGLMTVEDTIPRPNGEERVVRTVKRALPSTSGQPRYLLGMSEDVTELRSYQARITHVAMHDALTGLPNRAAFTERAEAVLGAGAAGCFALLLIDVDHFKVINDSMGHPAGDALLCEVGARLAALKGPDGIVARLGGDEFALVVAVPRGRAAERAAIELAQAVLRSFEAPFHLDGVCEHVGASVGVALAPEHGQDVNTLFRNADLALYAAKADGRSTFRFYESAFRLQAERRHALTIELRRALAEDEFELFYQPLLSLADGRISGFEALIRWRHPERGLLSPAAFIEVAEETGLISAIGEWVIHRACRTAAAWPGHLSVAVNLSALQFKQIGLLASVVAALSASGLRPGRLELEVTESVLLSDTSQNLQILHALRELGLRIAMDDFGTGYSSLGNLRAFPFGKIKMDRSFTAGIETDPGSLAISRAVIGLGSGFNLVTTAEGVETEAQLARLRAEGFGEAQGYLIAKPMPAGEIEGFLARYGQGDAVRLSA